MITEKGNNKAREELFENLRGRFELFAKLKVRDYMVEDVVQEALKNVLAKWDKEKEFKCFQAYAHKILRNTIGNIF
jgi:DNA-directed RNA polymerase specialized sigma24 family protein